MVASKSCNLLRDNDLRYLAIRDLEHLSLCCYGCCGDLGCLSAKALGFLAVSKACGVDAYVELCSEHCAACCECSYTCVRH